MMKYRQQISVNFNYDVVFTRDLFAPSNHILAETLEQENLPARLAFFVDSGVVNKWPKLLTEIVRWAKVHSDSVILPETPMVVPGGEAAKNDLIFVERMTHQFQRMQLCRHSYVVAVGGGAVLDAVGVGAAVFHRGIRLIRVPTTVLSQDDSGVGVKNSINLDNVKNLIGTFAPPYAVINDSRFLTTLEDRDWFGGLSEAFKVAIIKDLPLLDQLDLLAEDIAARKLEPMERIVQRCAMIHLDHIRMGGDAFESGSARPLDFGHWSAHKLEAMTHFELRHGEAVAIGIALDLYCASRLGFISNEDRDRVCEIMRRCKLDLWHPVLQKRSVTGTPLVIAGLEEFRQHLGGRLTLTMPCPLGSKREIHELSPTLVADAITWLAESRANTRV